MRRPASCRRIRAMRISSVTTAVTSQGYTLNAPHYKRVPRGFDKEHPRANWLLYNSLYSSYSHIPPTQVSSPQLTDICLEHDRQFFAHQVGFFWENDSIWTTKAGLARRAVTERQLCHRGRARHKSRAAPRHTGPTAAAAVSTGSHTS